MVALWGKGNFCVVVRTFAGELGPGAVDLQLDPAPPLGVLAAAQVRHGLLAFLVNVHITG